MKTQKKKSAYMGVTFSEKKGWIATAVLEGKRVEKTGFGSELEAIEARRILVQDGNMPIAVLRERVQENVDVSEIDDRWVSTLDRNRAMVKPLPGPEHPDYEPIRARSR